MKADENRTPPDWPMMRRRKKLKKAREIVVSAKLLKMAGERLEPA
jgi:hypothetical protein